MSLSPHLAGLKTEEGYFNSEIQFIEKIMYPLYEAANQFSDQNLGEIMDCLKFTKDYYTEQLEAEKKKSVPKDINSSIQQQQ